jgi:magnesium-transporting ATPase (P-type)
MRFKGLYAIDHMRGVDILLLDTQATAETTIYAPRIMIGHTVYTVSGEGYTPTGTIANPQGKKVTKAGLAELSLFFEAAALSHHTAVLAPGAGRTDWSVHGNHLEGALLTLARRAGLQTETLRDKHALLQAFHLDHHRHIASSVRQYGDDRVVFAYGQPDSILVACQKLWDHGHVRSISAADRARFTHHHIAATAEGLHTVALAYRILPKRATAKLTSDKAEEKLIFLGFVDVALATHPHLQATLQAARDAGAKVSLLTADLYHTYAINSEQLRKMTDAQVLERLRKGTATFAGLAAEDKIRLVHVAQARGLRVALTGICLADTAALTQADVSVALMHAPASVRSAALVQIENTATLLECVRIASDTARRLDYVFRVISAATAGLASLAFLSGVGSLLFYLPQAITAPRVLALTWFVYPLLALGNARIRTEDAHEARYMQKTTLLFGLLAGGLSFTSYLLYFALQDLDPAHIATASRFSVAAGSIALATLVACQLIDAALRYDWRRITMAKLALPVLTLMLLTAMIYTPTGHQALMLSTLNLSDLFVVLGTASLYLVAKLFERTTRHHTRHTIIKLHHETFGKSSSVRI